LLNRPEAIQANDEAIYDALKRLPDRALEELQPPPPDDLGGWMELTRILRGPANQRSDAIRGWRSRYLGHPADGPFLDGLLGKSDRTKPAPARSKPEPVSSRPEPVQVTPMTAPTAPPPAAGGRVIGVMLPLTGTYGPAGQAVKAGMEAAAAADPNPAKPQLRFSDTQGGDPASVYHALTGGGAEFVVGPLTKEDLTALAKSAELTVPVLALNQVKEVQSASIYQFGLTPEQELEQSAGSAWFDGRQSALMLAPASAFGQRMIHHFTAYWRSLGGNVVSIKTYKAGGDDFSGPARELLAAAGGGHADFVFLVADGRDGSLLKSYLEAQQPQGQSLPTYATSQIYNGRPDVPQNPDLSGIAFCDIPWLLDGGNAGPLSRQALQPALDRTPENYRRLIPMGLDAYRLIPELTQLQTSPQQRFNGATGVLTLTPDNRVQRQLHCAQFDSGTLQARGIAPLLQPGAQPAGRDGGQ
jgi:outer membrane PBP1 activator LpoA protein